MRFTSIEEMEGRPRYLDKNIAVSPALALNALALESEHLGAVARRMSKAALSQEKGVGARMKSDRKIVSQLVTAIGDFIMRLERTTMPTDIATQLPKVLRTTQYYLMTAELAVEVAALQTSVSNITDEVLIQNLSRYRADVVQLLDATDVQAEDFSLTDCENRLMALKTSYDDLKAFILETGASANIDISSMSALLEQNSHARRLSEQMVKAARYLSGLFVNGDISMVADVQ